jgi:hypothetical protein
LAFHAVHASNDYYLKAAHFYHRGLYFVDRNKAVGEEEEEGEAVVPILV